jgi:hypothetical protein
LTIHRIRACDSLVRGQTQVRNPKSEINSNVENAEKLFKRQIPFEKFVPLNFENCFGFRASTFEFQARLSASTL